MSPDHYHASSRRAPNRPAAGHADHCAGRVLTTRSSRRRAGIPVTRLETKLRKEGRSPTMWTCRVLRRTGPAIAGLTARQFPKGRHYRVMGSIIARSVRRHRPQSPPAPHAAATSFEVAAPFRNGLVDTWLVTPMHRQTNISDPHPRAMLMRWANLPTNWWGRRRAPRLTSTPRRRRGDRSTAARRSRCSISCRIITSRPSSSALVDPDLRTPPRLNRSSPSCTLAIRDDTSSTEAITPTTTRPDVVSGDGP